MKRALLLIVSLLAACTTATQAPPAAAPAAAPAAVAAAPSAPVHVVLVGTTDLHGWFAGHQEGYGGVATLASYVNALRDANGGRVVLVDSGDLFQGTLESNLFEGEPVVRGYNMLGYSAAAVGNHEFDYGPVGPDSVARSTDEDPLGTLKKNAGSAQFPFLSANMKEKATGRTPQWAKPWIIKEVGGVKIGIIGLSTPDTPNVTQPANVATLEFTDPVAATMNAASELHAQFVDAIVVIAHMGGRCTDINDVHDVASCEVNQEAMHLLQSLPPGTIDAYFAGHTHSQMRQFINGVPATQGLAYSREFSTIDLWIDPAGHRVIADKTMLRPLTMICSQVWSGTESCDPKGGKNGATLVPRVFEGKTIAPDAKLAALFEPYLAKTAAKKNEQLGVTTTAVFHRTDAADSELGDLLTDALRAYEKTDIAFLNPGGLRTDLRAGQLVYSDIFEVSPFDNFPTVVTLTGAQLQEILRLTTMGERRVLQVSGLRYVVDRALPEGQRVTSVTLANGKPLDPNATYTVALPDFLAAGGDGLGDVMKSVPPDRMRIRYEDGPLREVFIAALHALPQPVAPKTDQRIQVLNQKKRSGPGGD
jgi:5'-nucleotidase